MTPHYAPPGHTPQTVAVYQGMITAEKNLQAATPADDPVKAGDGGMCSNITLKSKLLAVAAISCVLVAAIVPYFVIASQGGSEGTSSVPAQMAPSPSPAGGATAPAAVPAEVIIERQKTIPDKTFQYRRFLSCSDLAVQMEGQVQQGVTAGIADEFTYIVDRNWLSSGYTPAPSDYCSYCDCSNAPPRNEWPGPMMALEAREGAEADGGAAQSGDGGGGGASLSSTNNQVQGVDEADIVKTDGKHVFVAGARSQLVVATALPLTEAAVLSTTDLSLFGLSVWQPADMVVSSDGNSLLVIGHVTLTQKGASTPDYVQSTVVMLFDVTDKANPTAVSADQIEGQYSTARLSGNHAYVIVNTYPAVEWVAVRRASPLPPPASRHRRASVSIQPPREGYKRVMKRTAPMYRKLSSGSLPTSAWGGVPFRGAYGDCGQISYVNSTIVDAWVNILAIDLTPGGQKHGQSTVLTHAGRGGTVMVSAESIYVAAANYDYAPARWSDATRGGTGSVGMWTVVLKFAMNSGNPTYSAQAEVPGALINQFAMDEHNGYLRVATTNGEVWSDPPTSTNAVYVFDGGMSPAGAVEGMAPGERIYSVRFAGDRGYVVTFRQVDPLFVLDLSDPKNPSQLGQLKVPGFSDYLHPVDKDTIVGVGKETQTSSDGRTTTTGVKVSLFDIANPASPREAAVTVVGQAGSSTPVSWEHKAFTFNPSTGLMAFPITENGKDYRPVYDGVFVWRVTGGSLRLLGRTTQSVRDFASEDSWFYGYGDDVRSIKRSLYVQGGEGEETLLTFSARQFRAHKVKDFSLTAEAKPVASVDLTKPDCSQKPWEDTRRGAAAA
eukprot:CAMPEP_0174915998 /NCGR_PEP_ID=MMETSP1355-20121228/1501_1 /TAXON_ID=464990 /ORGANISM="Hemiselmis tepida, Strain CCMP443" /LENGTH=833 /DNA_ID=CAMNT_0016160959 /DNA_START=122 /DNA_END=2623 /DNA_ORIENTATION=-